MPKMTADDRLAHQMQFNSCYFACRALRDIIAYVDDEATRPQWHHNPEVSQPLFIAIASGEFHEELVTWRRIFADRWNELQKNGHIVQAVEEQRRRPIGELTRTYHTVSGMIRSLESRLFGILLTSRLQASVQ